MGRDQAVSSSIGTAARQDDRVTAVLFTATVRSGASPCLSLPVSFRDAFALVHGDRVAVWSGEEAGTFFFIPVTGKNAGKGCQLPATAKKLSVRKNFTLGIPRRSQEGFPVGTSVAVSTVPSSYRGLDGQNGKEQESLAVPESFRVTVIKRGGQPYQLDDVETVTYRTGLLHVPLGWHARQDGYPSLDEVLVAKNTFIDPFTGASRPFTPVEKVTFVRDHLKPLQQAVAARVRTLGCQSTELCTRHTAETLDLLQQGRLNSGARGSNLGTALGDGANLGCSAYGQLLASCRGYYSLAVKLAGRDGAPHLYPGGQDGTDQDQEPGQWKKRGVAIPSLTVRQFFTAHVTAWYEYLLFSRSPFAERYLATCWDVKRTWSRDTLVSFRDRIDPHLAGELQHGRPFPFISLADFKKACAVKLAEVDIDLLRLKMTGKDTWATEGFRKKLVTVHEQAAAVHAVLFHDYPRYTGKKREEASGDAAEVRAPLAVPVPPAGLLSLTVGWRPLKQLAHELVYRLKVLPLTGKKTTYHSALRAVLSLAAARYSPLAVTFQGTGVDTLTVERCLTVPFHADKRLERQEHARTGVSPRYRDRIKTLETLLDDTLRASARAKQARQPVKMLKVLKNRQQRLLDQLEEVKLWNLYPPLPVDLLMGPKYVITRPGNSDVMTEVLKEKGTLPLGFKHCRPVPGDKPVTIEAFVVGTDQIMHALAGGARVVMLRVIPPRGPKQKVPVDVVLEGPARAFASINHLAGVEQQLEGSTGCTGIDVNRASPYMVAFSSGDDRSPASQLSSETLTVIDRFKATGQTIAGLQAARARAEERRDHVKAGNLARQITLHHGKKQNYLKDLHAHRCMVETGREVVRNGSSILAVERLNTGDARGLHGGLAKAVYSMPDDPAIPKRVARNTSTFYSQAWNSKEYDGDQPVPAPAVSVVTVDPRGTSTVHARCPVTPEGTLDRGNGHHDNCQCRGCQHVINSHVNGANGTHDRCLASLPSPPPVIVLPPVPGRVPPGNHPPPAP